MPAEACGKHAVIGRRQSATLQVAEQCGAHLTVHQWLQAVLQRGAYAAHAQRIGVVGNGGGHGQAGADLARAFVDADHGAAARRLVAAAALGHRLEAVGQLGQQEHVGPAGQATFQRDPSQVAALVSAVITRPWLRAVVHRRSSASATIATALSKPKVRSVQNRSVGIIRRRGRPLRAWPEPFRQLLVRSKAAAG